jgi:hypothetical protein
MAYKIKPGYKIDNTPVYFVPEDKNVLGRANKNGTITINEKVRDKKLLDKIISHEKVHLKQIEKGLIWYDNDYMYHRKSTKDPWKKVKRSLKMDGNKSHWWEKEAYKKQNK